jgi:hypothetical protein
LVFGHKIYFPLAPEEGERRILDDTENYGYVSTRGVPLNTLDRIQASRGSIIPETCFETKVQTILVVLSKDDFRFQRGIAVKLKEKKF